MHEKTKDYIIWAGVAGGLIFTAGLVLNIASKHSTKVAAFVAKLRGT
jgi:hypothetical protein